MGKNQRLKVHRQWLPGRSLCSIRSNRKWCKRRGSSLECQNCFFVYPIIDSNLKNLCNKHYGQRMLLITYEISKKLYPNKPLYLEVRTWNIRAVKCYQKAGFRIDGQAYELTTGIGTGTFYRMIRE